MRRRVVGLLVVAAAFVVPLALAAMWVPVRTRLANTDLALILVLSVLALGTSGRRSVVVVATASAAFWFELLNTRPFGHVAIERLPDLVTTLVLAVVALAGGELAVRVTRHRASARAETVRFAGVSEAASLLASGEELVLVIQAVGRQLVALLQLEECTFGAGPAPERVPAIGRSGDVIGPDGRALGVPVGCRGLVLPVWGHRQVLGHYLLVLDPDAGPPRRPDVAAAVTLADQVGAAFMAQAPPPPDPTPGPPRGLFVVR